MRIGNIPHYRYFLNRKLLLLFISAENFLAFQYLQISYNVNI